MASGSDTIEESASAVEELDTVFFGSDVAPSDVRLFSGASDLVVEVGNSVSRLTIKRYFTTTELLGNGTTQAIDNRIEFFHFSDGTVWDRAAVESRVLSADTMVGTAGNDVFSVDTHWTW
ncbi:MAG: hypothetical protein HC793_03815 [Aquincola sp.]|nr:hypothetical protein [Aquincola sp.]